MTYLISLILLILPVYLVRFSIAGIPTTLLEIIIYIVFLIGLWQASKVGFRKLPLKIWLPILLLVIALLISSAISPDKAAALGIFKGFFIDAVLVFWLTFQFVKPKDLPKLTTGLAISALFVAAYTIMKKITGTVEPDGRIIGVFGYSPNYTSLFLTPITVWLLTFSFVILKNKKWALSLGIWALVVVNLLAIYFSGSRGALVAILAGILAFLVAHYWPLIRQKAAYKISVLAVVIVALLAFWFAFRPNFDASSGTRVTSSSNIRWQIWGASFELAVKHPIFGVGLDNFQNAFKKLTQNRGNFKEYIIPQALTPHNIFLMFWLETGVLGLISFVWILVIFLKETLKKIEKPMLASLLAVMIAILFYGLVESSIWKNDLSVLFWFFTSLAWVL